MHRVTRSVHDPRRESAQGGVAPSIGRAVSRFDLSPTKLDKIKNLFPEVQTDRLAVRLSNEAHLRRCAYDCLGNTEELAS